MSVSSQYTLEYVRWRDHCKSADMSEVAIEDLLDVGFAVWESVGWVIRETPEHLVLAHSIIGSEVIGWLVILKATIEERKHF